MKCLHCQFENREGVTFCEKCGTSLELECSNCRTAIPADRSFCGNCGHKIITEAEIREKELVSESERKHVTVLFSDLSGYTVMSEKLDPEEVKEITSHLFDNVSKIISKYNGFIEKYAGDAVMAIFGANQSQEDDPIRAVRSAKEIHDLVTTLSPRYEAKIRQPLSMHTGINTGLVVTGVLNMEKGVHGVAGDTINVAARLSATAKAGDILVDHETYSRSEGYFHFEDLKTIQLKGKTNAVHVHRFLSAKEQPRKIHRLHGLRAELIGRKAEMARLSGAVEKLRRGKGAIFSIIGNAGTGKSRLVEEFKASLDLKEIQWLEGNAFPYAQNIPYFPLIDLISKAIQTDESDSSQTVKEKLESNLEVFIGEKQDIAPYIGRLYALDYPEIGEVSPEFWKTKLQKAVLMVLRALAQRAPTVICLEDLHWADPSTVELVHFLLSEIRYPLLFLCVYRPTISQFSTHQIKAIAIPHQELHLQDFSFSEAQNMVESLLNIDSIPKDLNQFIRDKVEGNPFYLEEAINSLIESKILVPENGNWKVVGPITESEISATIQGVISARVDRLEQKSKRILQEASVIGRSFYYDILRGISELKDSIDQSLSGLERFDLIKTKSIEPYLEYIFKHALTQEVVYNGLLKKERREIHHRIGLVMEQLFQDRLSEFSETLAFHFANSQTLDRAVAYLTKSGEKSLKRYAVEESHQYYKEAFDLLSSKPDRNQKENKLLIDLLIKWAFVFYYRGDFRGLLDLLRIHEHLAESLEDTAKVGMYCAWLGFALWARENYEDSYQYLLKALRLGEEIENPEVIGYACKWLIYTCAELGLTEESIAFGKRVQEVCRFLESDQYLYFKSLAGLGLGYFFKGEIKKALETGKAVVDYGQRHSNIRSQVMGHWIMGFSYFLDGDFPLTIESCKKAMEITADPWYSHTVMMLFGMGSVLDGQFQEGEKALKEVVNYSDEFGGEQIGTPACMFLAVALIAQGKMSKGLKIIEEAQQTFLEKKRKYAYALSLYVLGKVYLQIAEGAGPKSLSFLARNIGFLAREFPFAARKAEDHFSRAIEVAKEIGAKGLLGQAYLDLGLLHKRKKKMDKSRECIVTAVDLFGQCGAENYLKQGNEALENLE